MKSGCFHRGDYMISKSVGSLSSEGGYWSAVGGNPPIQEQGPVSMGSFPGKTPAWSSLRLFPDAGHADSERYSGGKGRGLFY